MSNLTKEIKLALLKEYRFKKSFDCVCTEGFNNSDIAAIKAGRKLVEIEIKISKSDFKAEFKHKDTKHFSYLNPEKEGAYSRVPNQFYFCVPENISEWALKELERHNPKYGLIMYLPTCFVYKKPAKMLHTNPPTEKDLRVLAKRATSEMINLYIKEQQ